MNIYKFMAVSAVALVVGGCSSSNNAESGCLEISKMGKTENIVTLDDDLSLRPGVALDKVTIIDFNASWCVPCRKLTPVFHELAHEYGDKANFVSVDIDDYPQVASAFRVESVPTVIILDASGKELKRYVGIGDLLPAENFDKIVKGII